MVLLECIPDIEEEEGFIRQGEELKFLKSAKIPPSLRSLDDTANIWIFFNMGPGYIFYGRIHFCDNTAYQDNNLFRHFLAMIFRM